MEGIQDCAPCQSHDHVGKEKGRPVGAAFLIKRISLVSSLNRRES